MRAVLSSVVAVFLAVSVAGPAVAQQVKGRANVTSGDTIVVDRKSIRLAGIDAPELDQYCENEFGRPFQCGMQALDALRTMVGRLAVTCVVDGQDDDGANRGTCYAGDLNLNTRMVRTGWAVARPAERPDYEYLEKIAKREKAGIWALKFEDPAAWRAANQ